MAKTAPKEKMFVCNGRCTIFSGSGKKKLSRGEICDITGPGIEIADVEVPSLLLRVGGSWMEKTGGSGVFELKSSQNPRNIGDPVSYFRNTDFDNHFHDCDEYWFILEGKGIAVTEGTAYNVSAGDCIITRKGNHHDFPVVDEPVLGVYFETTLLDRRRTGHLWNHTHEK